MINLRKGCKRMTKQDRLGTPHTSIMVRKGLGQIMSQCKLTSYLRMYTRSVTNGILFSRSRTRLPHASQPVLVDFGVLPLPLRLPPAPCSIDQPTTCPFPPERLARSVADLDHRYPADHSLPRAHNRWKTLRCFAGWKRAGKSLFTI
jgi:hypothetical protein